MIYIIRHGQTDWNKEERLQGLIDVPLNDVGKQAAIDAGKENTVKFDVCYCSPLTRAKQTAELFLHGQDTEIIIDERIREVSFGSYEGQTVRRSSDSPIRRFFMDPANYVPENGVEGYDKLYERIDDFLSDVIAKEITKNRNVLICCHGVSGKCIVNEFHDTPLRDFWLTELQNCQLLRLL